MDFSSFTIFFYDLSTPNDVPLSTATRKVENDTAQSIGTRKYKCENGHTMMLQHHFSSRSFEHIHPLHSLCICRLFLFDYIRQTEKNTSDSSVVVVIVVATDAAAAADGGEVLAKRRMKMSKQQSDGNIFFYYISLQHTQTPSSLPRCPIQSSSTSSETNTYSFSGANSHQARICVDVDVCVCAHTLFGLL